MKKKSKEDSFDPPYQENEVNGKFRITSEKWNDNLANPDTKEFQELAATMKKGLLEMLAQEQGLSEQAEFEVDIIGFRFVFSMNFGREKSLKFITFSALEVWFATLRSGTS